MERDRTGANTEDVLLALIIGSEDQCTTGSEDFDILPVFPMAFRSFRLKKTIMSLLLSSASLCRDCVISVACLHTRILLIQSLFLKQYTAISDLTVTTL